MPNPEHESIVRELTSRIRTWRKKHPDVQLDLREASLQDVEMPYADLHGADLTSSDLSVADLSQSDLSETLLRSSNLFGAKLRGARLTEADLFSADLRGSDLRDCDLTGVNLIGAALTGAKLQGCNFTDTLMGFTALGDVDLSGAIGLETVKHYGPSIIGFDTLHRSMGKISPVFLEGCGVSADSFRAAAETLSKLPSYLTCYLLFTSDGKELADKLASSLNQKKIRIWKWQSEDENSPLVAALDQAIDLYDKLILLGTKESLENPDIIREIDQALKKEKSNGTRILYLLDVDGYAAEHWQDPKALTLQARGIIDFANWQDDYRYFKSLDQLTSHLK